MERDDDRRSQPRVAFKVPAHILLGPSEQMYRGFVLNLSQSGVFVMMDQGPQVGPAIVVQFQFPHDTWCEATGHVAHADDMGVYQGLGVELTQHNLPYTNFIRMMMKATPQQIMHYMDEIRRIIVRG